MVRAVGRFGRECEPYILPLFPLESEQMMGRDGDAIPPANQSNHQPVIQSNSGMHKFPFHSTFQSEVRQYLRTRSSQLTQSRDRSRLASMVTFPYLSLPNFFILTFAVESRER